MRSTPRAWARSTSASALGCSNPFSLKYCVVHRRTFKTVHCSSIHLPCTEVLQRVSDGLPSDSILDFARLCNRKGQQGGHADVCALSGIRPDVFFPRQSF